MGRIADIIPALYHGKDNELIPFVEALDVEVKDLERKVRGITDLINIDKCPDEKLPYLAALTNCPLIGDDPAFWRKQIRNWPYILKLKGTERSLELVLDSIGADSWVIKTFFRDAGGGYITTKPTGQPFKDSDGLWHNIRTHYFGIEFVMSEAFVEGQDFIWDSEELKEKLALWFEHGKPYHAELLNMIILPPKFIDDDHICRWDVCNWEHAELIPYKWGIITPNEGIDDSVCVLHGFERGLFNMSDVAFWDVSSWDEMPYRLLTVGAFYETGIFASLEWGEGDAAMLSPNLWDYSQWDFVSTYSNVIGFEFDYTIPAAVIQDAEQIISAFTYTDIICDLRPRWDAQSWQEHYTWIEYTAHDIIPEYVRGIAGSLDWNDKHEYPASFWDKDRWDSVNYPPNYDAPLPKWSAFKTWQKSNTWDTTAELSATLEIDYQEDL